MLNLSREEWHTAAGFVVVRDDTKGKVSVVADCRGEPGDTPEDIRKSLIRAYCVAVAPLAFRTLDRLLYAIEAFQREFPEAAPTKELQDMQESATHLLKSIRSRGVGL